MPTPALASVSAALLAMVTLFLLVRASVSQTTKITCFVISGMALVTTTAYAVQAIVSIDIGPLLGSIMWATVSFVMWLAGRDTP